ncbi:glycosyltransferase family 4 protein [Actinosynnema mirum]|uniref:Glycosyl transferase group 1 n=1 Tax=Actinosynnema mirum (strain ATCC 29888 / DSM 43827 / JCM 3225 / NBRC 14064 / NCIMB 13271 / NRRL B-12336 / IMRU 3971 / 101) TaxID=446462 RepID=C6WBX8_ACTMD|nr:glycosyltransferase family 4 protein [Actinosynnema mirum]ACU37545.1 glycosyl transferase group 1 [Actinosynnema mirum DSM 43827]
MRFLVVTGTRPWQATGGALRIRATSQALAELGAVDLIVFRFKDAPPVEDDPPTGPFHKVLALDDAYDTPRNRAALEEALPGWLDDEPYDMVWYDRERLWQIAGGLTSGKSVVDVDDLEDVILERWSELGKSPDRRDLDPEGIARQRQEAALVGAGHAEVAAAADAVVLTSDSDAARLAFGNSTVIPNTYLHDDETGQAAVDRVHGVGDTILFQGWLQWPPNEDAAIWFATDVLPRVRAQHPQARLLLVGKPSQDVVDLGSLPGVEVVGEVPHMRPYLDRAHVVVAPLRVGGGTRIKILEGFASGIPVVSTTVGCEGLGGEDAVHLRIEDDSEAFADAVARLLRDGDARRSLAERARALYEQRYTPQAVNEAVHRLVEQVTSQAAQPEG